MDEAIGLKFALIARRSALSALPPEVLQTWADQQVVVLDDRHDALRHWLDKHHVQGLVLRPDRYIMGVAETTAQWSALTHMLPGAAQQPH
jgi:3-(3-hydroxy-phenyl)propionate hydroxylase